MTVNVSLLIMPYLAVATFVTVWTFHGGVIARPREKLFTINEKAILLALCIAAGLFWVLFIPGLAIAFTRYLAQVVDGWRRAAVHARAARARS